MKNFYEQILDRLAVSPSQTLANGDWHLRIIVSPSWRKVRIYDVIHQQGRTVLSFTRFSDEGLHGFGATCDPGMVARWVPVHREQRELPEDSALVRLVRKGIIAKIRMREIMQVDGTSYRFQFSTPEGRLELEAGDMALDKKSEALLEALSEAGAGFTHDPDDYG